MNPGLLNKVFTGLVFFLSLFYAFWLGVDIERGDTKEIIADVVLLGFWLFALAFIVVMNRQERKMERELRKAEQGLHHALGDVFSEIEQDLKARQDRREQFTSVFKEVTGKKFTDAKTVSARHKTQIEKRFNERTGLYANITVHKGGKIEVDISNKKAPVKRAAPGRSAAHDAAAKRGDASRKAANKKPVTTKKGK